jgi:hypothetical protein
VRVAVDRVLGELDPDKPKASDVDAIRAKDPAAYTPVNPCSAASRAGSVPGWTASAAWTTPRRPPATADGRLARAEVRARLARQVARARRRWRRPRSGRRAGEPFL